MFSAFYDYFICFSAERTNHFGVYTFRVRFCCCCDSFFHSSSIVGYLKIRRNFVRLVKYIVLIALALLWRALRVRFWLYNLLRMCVLLESWRKKTKQKINLRIKPNEQRKKNKNKATTAAVVRRGNEKRRGKSKWIKHIHKHTYSPKWWSVAI